MANNSNATEEAPSQAPPKFREENLGKWCQNRQGMEVEYLLLRALNGGTKAMREMGTSLLPMDWRERQVPRDYCARRDRTTLYPGYSDAVDQIASRPFQRSVTLKDGDKLEGNLKRIENDTDREGTDLTAFSRWLLGSVVDRGIGLFIVDNPQTPAEVPDGLGGKRAAQLPDVEALDLRPYFIRVTADNLIDWAWRTDKASGREVLAYIQLFDENSRTDPDTGDEQTVQRIRYWSETEWAIWERKIPAPSALTGNDVDSPDLTTRAKLSWQRSLNNLKEQGPRYFRQKHGTHPLGEVPLVAVNVNPCGPDRLTARPPLGNLAWLNVAHWQSQSQQANILHYVRAPILKGSGVPKDLEDGTRQIVLGAGATAFSSSPDFDLSWVSADGSAIADGREDLKGIEDKMSKLGMQPLMMPVTSPQTATGVAADELRTQSKAQSWVEATEWGLYRGYELAAKWEGVKLHESFTITIFRDNSLLSRSQQDLDALDKMRTRGDISLPTFLAAVIERGTLPRDLDIDAEVLAVEGEKEAAMQQFTAEAEVMAASKAANNPDAPPEPAQKKAKAA